MSPEPIVIDGDIMYAQATSPDGMTLVAGHPPSQSTAEADPEADPEAEPS